MTNGQHTEWLAASLQSAPIISDSLRRANAIACFKELYAIGVIDKEHYKTALMDIMRLERFEIK